MEAGEKDGGGDRWSLDLRSRRARKLQELHSPHFVEQRTGSRQPRERIGVLQLPVFRLQVVCSHLILSAFAISFSSSFVINQFYIRPSSHTLSYPTYLDDDADADATKTTILQPIRPRENECSQSPVADPNHASILLHHFADAVTGCQRSSRLESCSAIPNTRTSEF